jgi:hypothetical protein
MFQTNPLSNDPNASAKSFARSASPLMRERRIDRVYDARIRGEVASFWGICEAIYCVFTEQFRRKGSLRRLSGCSAAETQAFQERSLATCDLGPLRRVIDAARLADMTILQRAFHQLVAKQRHDAATEKQRT